LWGVSKNLLLDHSSLPRDARGVLDLDGHRIVHVAAGGSVLAHRMMVLFGAPACVQNSFWPLITQSVGEWVGGSHSMDQIKCHDIIL